MSDPFSTLSIGILHPPDLPTGHFRIREDNVGVAILIHVADDCLCRIESERWLEIFRRRCVGTDGNLFSLGAIALHISIPDIRPHHIEVAITVISQGKSRVYRIANGHVVDTRQISIEDKALERNGEVTTVTIPGAPGDDVQTTIAVDIEDGSAYIGR